MFCLYIGDDEDVTDCSQMRSDASDAWCTNDDHLLVPFPVPDSMTAASDPSYACPLGEQCPGDRCCQMCAIEGCETCCCRGYCGDEGQCLLKVCYYCNVKHQATTHDTAEARRELLHELREVCPKDSHQLAHADCPEYAQCQQCKKSGCAACLKGCLRGCPLCNCDGPLCNWPLCNCDVKTCMNCHNARQASKKAQLRIDRLRWLGPRRRQMALITPKAPPAGALEMCTRLQPICDIPRDRSAGPNDPHPPAKPYQPGDNYPSPDASSIPCTRLLSMFASGSHMRTGHNKRLNPAVPAFPKPPPPPHSQREPSPPRRLAVPHPPREPPPDGKQSWSSMD